MLDMDDIQIPVSSIYTGTVSREKSNFSYIMKIT